MTTRTYVGSMLFEPELLSTRMISAIELNARLLGDMAKAAVSRVYGVDYNDLHLLLALGENDRAEALSQPFLDGPQYWWETLFHRCGQGRNIKFWWCLRRSPNGMS